MSEEAERQDKDKGTGGSHKVLIPATGDWEEDGGGEGASPTPLLALHRQQAKARAKAKAGGLDRSFQEEEEGEEEEEGDADDDYDNEDEDMDSEAEDARLHPTRRLLVLCACTLVGFVMNVMVSVVRLSGVFWGVLCFVLCFFLGGGGGGYVYACLSFVCVLLK